MEGVVSVRLLLAGWLLSNDDDDDVDPLEGPLRDWSACVFGLVPPPMAGFPEFALLLLLLTFTPVEYDLVLGLEPIGLEFRLLSDMLLR